MKMVALALCIVYALILVHPTTTDAVGLAEVAVGTMVASFMIDVYRSLQTRTDPVATTVIQNRQMMEELHGRFDTFGYSLERFAQDVAGIPQAVRHDVNKALDLYRLHEVGGLRTRISDCAELDKIGQECDVELKQLWTDYAAQTAAFFRHGGLAAVALPKIYEFERWYLLVTGKDSLERLAQVRRNYARAVQVALTRGRLPEGFQNRRNELTRHSATLKAAKDEMHNYYRDHRCGGRDGSDVRISSEWRDLLKGRVKTRALEYQRAWRAYKPYREVWATLAVFYAERLYEPGHGMPLIDDVVKRHIRGWERRNHDRFKSQLTRSYIEPADWRRPVCESRCMSQCRDDYYVNVREWNEGRHWSVERRGHEALGIALNQSVWTGCVLECPYGRGVGAERDNMR